MDASKRVVKWVLGGLLVLLAAGLTLGGCATNGAVADAGWVHPSDRIIGPNQF